MAQTVHSTLNTKIVHMMHELETVFTHIRRYFFMGDLDKVADLLNLYDYHKESSMPDRFSHESLSNDSNI